MTGIQRPSRRGQLVVFEGPDGVGKSTIAAQTATALRSAGKQVRLLSFPGRDPGTFGSLVYRLHHDRAKLGVERIGAATLQLAHIAAHVEAIATVVEPALASGTTVLLDRFWWSNWVYGHHAGVSPDLIEAMLQIERVAWKGTLPAIAILLKRSSPIDRKVNIGEWRALVSRYSDLAEKQRLTHAVAVVSNNAAISRTCELVLREILKHCAASPTSQLDLELGIHVTETKHARPTARAPSTPVTSALAPARTSIVYETYWRFAAERQRIFFKRFAGDPSPWTRDPILESFKFTNAYRASDRVSQYLIRNVIYRQDLPTDADEVVFRILLFKLFNKIATWELLESVLGAVTLRDYSFERYDAILGAAMRRGARIYSAAYIMPPGGTVFGQKAKHQNHLLLLERMMHESIADRLRRVPTMQSAFDLLRSYPTIGDFLAYQFVTDINYSEVTDFSEMSFVVPGPGARDGLRKCFANSGGLNEAELIRLVADVQEREFERLGLHFESLWGRPLQLIDCQNLFCEVDKYARVKHPEVKGVTGRTRIKQRYSLHEVPLTYWYPPKWGLNEKIAADRRGRVERSKGGLLWS